MVVASLNVNVQVCTKAVGKRAEKILHQFSREFTDLVTLECTFKNKKRPATEIECDLVTGLVQRQEEAIPLEAPLVSQRLPDCIAKGKPGVFHGVMFVHMQVSL